MTSREIPSQSTAEMLSQSIFVHTTAIDVVAVIISVVSLGIALHSLRLASASEGRVKEALKEIIHLAQSSEGFMKQSQSQVAQLHSNVVDRAFASALRVPLRSSCLAADLIEDIRGSDGPISVTELRIRADSRSRSKMEREYLNAVLNGLVLGGLASKNTNEIIGDTQIQASDLIVK